MSVDQACPVVQQPCTLVVVVITQFVVTICVCLFLQTVQLSTNVLLLTSLAIFTTIFLVYSVLVGPAVASFSIFSFLPQQDEFQSTFVFVICLLMYMIIYDLRLDEMITPTKTE